MSLFHFISCATLACSSKPRSIQPSLFLVDVLYDPVRETEHNKTSKRSALVSSM